VLFRRVTECVTVQGNLILRSFALICIMCNPYSKRSVEMDTQKTCRFRRTCTTPPDAFILLPYYCVLDAQFYLLQEEWGSATTYNVRVLTYFLYGKMSIQLFLFYG